MSGRPESPCTGSSAARCPPAPGERGGRLRPRPHAPRELIAADQRERLAGAMVAAVGEAGYENASVDRIVALAGVSTKTLYRHFDSKLGCFLATYELLLEAGMQQIAAAWRSTLSEREDPTHALRVAVERYLTLPLVQPDAARLVLCETLQIGTGALQHLRRGEERVAAMIASALAGTHDGAEASTLPHALAHGLWYVTRTRMREGREQQLPAAAAPLAAWISSYEVSRLLDPPQLASDERSPIPARSSPSGSDPRRRLLLATAQLAAADGYAALSMPAIARRAEVGLETALDAFADPEECFLATLEMLSVSLLAQALREARHRESWAASICGFVHALLRHLANDETLARVLFVEILAVGRRGADKRDALLSGFAELLQRRTPQELRPEPIVTEALAGAFWGTLHTHLTAGQARRLPQRGGELAYLLLAPLLGVQAAREAIAAWPGETE